MSAMITPPIALTATPPESSKAKPRLMTTEELLAMPDDGVERWLINGELREQPGLLVGDRRMTVRNRFHSKVMAVVTDHLYVWRRSQPEPRGEVLCGEVGVRLRRTPESTVGIDVVYIEESRQPPRGTTSSSTGRPSWPSRSSRPR